MKLLIQIFGEGRNLNSLQMGCRGILIFIIALVLIRISGRRSFGIRTALDNIISILLGAILSRVVVGVSPFLPTTVACTVIVVMHRLAERFITHSPTFGKIAEGKRIVLFNENVFIKKNMDKGLVCKEDILQGVREAALTDSMKDIKVIYMERNGKISVVKKDGKQ